MEGMEETMMLIKNDCERQRRKEDLGGEGGILCWVIHVNYIMEVRK